MPGVFRINQGSKSLLIALCCSFSVIILLLYIGRHRFRFDFLFHWAGWLLIGLYMLYFLVFQSIAHFLILRRYNDEGKDLLTSLIAIPIGVAVILLFNMLRHAS